MFSVNDIDSLAEQLYTNSDSALRREAEKKLEFITKEINDIPIPTRPVADPNVVNTNGKADGVTEMEIDKENVPIQQSAHFNLICSILQQSNSQYTIFYISQALIPFYKNNEKLLSTAALENLICESYGQQCIKRLCYNNAPKSVMSAVLYGYAKLSKLTYAKEPFLNSCVSFALGLFTNPGTEDRLRLLGVQLVSALVVEHCKFDNSKSQTYMNFAVHRRCSNNFRDECLLNIFKVAVDALFQVPSAFNNNNNNNNNYTELDTQVVGLVRDVLTFDFMAVISTETDEQSTSQFPTSWKEFLLSEYTLKTLWGQHRALPYPLCGTLMEGLANLCGVRRTLFDDLDARIQYLDCILGMMCDGVNLQASQIFSGGNANNSNANNNSNNSNLFTNSDGNRATPSIINFFPIANDSRLTSSEYVTLFADAALRFIGPFGYRDLHQCSNFERWISILSQLSKHFFSIPFGQEGSSTTATSLLTFWDRLCQSRRMYISHEENVRRDLELAVPELTTCLFQSRVNSDRNSDFLDQDGEYDAVMEALYNQSASISSIILMDTRQTVGFLSDYVNQVLGPSVLNSPSATAWLFFIAGSIVAQVLVIVDEKDVDVCSQFLLFCVDCANHRRMSADSGTYDSRLYGLFVERALLHFMQNVQHVLICNRAHDALTAIITNVFQSKLNLFQFVLNNTGHNIMRGVSGEMDEETAQVMQQSIDLISDACRDITPQMLTDLRLELPSVVELPLSQSIVTYKLRTNLYKILWQLFPHSPYSASTLLSFLQPIETCIQNTLSGSITDSLYVAGWLRDLRGVSLALRDDPLPFCDFAEWFCDQCGGLLTLLRNPQMHSPHIISSFLQFLLALVDSNQTRYPLSQTNNHSALGLLVFKNVCTQLQQIIEVTITEEHIQRVTAGTEVTDSAYDVMLKPLSLSINCLQFCVQGGFVPFGAMSFYNDDTYDNTLLGLLRMINVFPLHLFKDYRRVTQSILELLRTITDEQTYHPLAKLSAAELESVISFTIYACEDVETDVTSLMAGLSFLAFIAGLIKEVKQISLTPALSSVGGNFTPPPATPMMLPSYYASPDGRVSGTPTQDPGNTQIGRAPRSLRRAREELAQTLEGFGDLWVRLLSVGMGIISLQDRGLSISVSVVYPIFETHPPFWYEYVEQFVNTYPERKRPAVREAVSMLTNNGETQSKFFSEVFAFRQQLRSI